jgi:hypothetical protein
MEDQDQEEYVLEKDVPTLERKARSEKLDGDHVRYLRDVVASPRALQILADNEERFGPLEDPDVADLRKDPERREARVQELRSVIEEAQRELNQLGEVAAEEAHTAGQAPRNPDGTVADLGARDDEPGVREARYKSMTNEQLREEISRRNDDGREDGDRMSTSGAKPELVSRLLEDDAWLAELGEDDE